jgi:DNA-binding FrmR family transcriptional regulator
MVDQERYCADILVQIASVQEALRGVSRLLMRNHLEHCATMAIRDGGNSASAMYAELLDLVYRHARWCAEAAYFVMLDTAAVAHKPQRERQRSKSSEPRRRRIRPCGQHL